LSPLVFDWVVEQNVSRGLMRLRFDITPALPNDGIVVPLGTPVATQDRQNMIRGPSLCTGVRGIPGNKGPISLLRQTSPGGERKEAYCTRVWRYLRTPRCSSSSPMAGTNLRRPIRDVRWGAGLAAGRRDARAKPAAWALAQTAKILIHQVSSGFPGQATDIRDPQPGEIHRHRPALGTTYSPRAQSSRLTRGPGTDHGA